VHLGGAARHFELGAATGAARGAEPTPVKAAVTAPVSVASIRPAAKPIEKDKPAVEKRATITLGDNKAPTTALGVGPAAPRSTIAGTPSAATRTTAPAAAPAAAAAPTPAAAAVAAAKGGASEWNPADDLDVLDDQPLPFPLPR